MKERDGKMLFVPDRVEVQRGEQVRFVLNNDGKLDHEFVLDDARGEPQARRSRCRRTPTWSMTTRTRSGSRRKTGEIVWHFTKAGTFEFACLIPGHREAGMTGKIIVK